MTDSKPERIRGYEHLLKALDHAEKAERLFPDDSREERVANNAVRWTQKAANIVDGELDE